MKMSLLNLNRNRLLTLNRTTVLNITGFYNELLNKFRNKSAHISTISRDKASDCKFLVRKILTRFLNLV